MPQRSIGVKHLGHARLKTENCFPSHPAGLPIRDPSGVPRASSCASLPPLFRPCDSFCSCRRWNTPSTAAPGLGWVLGRAPCRKSVKTVPFRWNADLIRQLVNVLMVQPPRHYLTLNGRHMPNSLKNAGGSVSASSAASPMCGPKSACNRPTFGTGPRSPESGPSSASPARGGQRRSKLQVEGARAAAPVEP